jgi:hypothetical protein
MKSKSCLDAPEICWIIIIIIIKKSRTLLEMLVNGLSASVNETFQRTLIEVGL